MAWFRKCRIQQSTANQQYEVAVKKNLQSFVVNLFSTSLKQLFAWMKSVSIDICIYLQI